MNNEELMSAFESLEEGHPVRVGLTQILEESVEEATAMVADVRLREAREFYAGWLAAVRSLQGGLLDLMEGRLRDEEPGEKKELPGLVRRPGGAR
jgi:hypothetical protein